MAQGKPYQAYQNIGVRTSNQKQLIMMLFDGMNRFMDGAVESINEGELEIAHHKLVKTGKILLELTSTLREDRGEEIAGNLKRLYVYSYEQIVIANLKKDVVIIRKVQELLNNLRLGWKEVSAGGMNQSDTNIQHKKMSVTG